MTTETNAAENTKKGTDAQATQALPQVEPTPADATQTLPQAEATTVLPQATPSGTTEAQPAEPQPANPQLTKAQPDAAQSAEGPDANTVWSASSLTNEPTDPREMDRPTGPRGSTTMWGTFLLMCGLLTIVLGTGVHLSLAVISVVVLATTGLSLMLVALIPQRSDRGPASA